MTAYVTAEEIRAQAGKLSDTDDTLLGALAAAATEAINNYCGRPDGFLAAATGSARLFAGTGTATMRIDECAAISLVEVKDSVTDTGYTAWAASDWIGFSGDPMRPDFNRLPYTGLMIAPGGSYAAFSDGRYNGRGGFRPAADRMQAVPTVRVTARWGYALVLPDVIRQACITQASRWYKRGQASWSDAIGNADVGQLFYRRVLDPDVELMLKAGRFVRMAVG
ncbi:MAG TPA: hypothetical protein PKD09_17805 [Aggregatilinea sp.]|uniref:hypothetical protein n=1 Tax=Aggregatilinea sp. TaxID=2806333 RepID=UPI002BFB2223|nr:hypothetical protein [Aggregatilinea sp.]HML23516.1 hypothetical protein [Aggregatilinea sp.]